MKPNIALQLAALGEAASRAAYQALPGGHGQDDDCPAGGHPVREGTD